MEILVFIILPIMTNLFKLLVFTHSESSFENKRKDVLKLKEFGKLLYVYKFCVLTF